MNRPHWPSAASLAGDPLSPVNRRGTEPWQVMVSPGHEPTAVGPRRESFRLVLLLYMAMLLTDAIRKLAGLPNSTIGIIYILVGAIYIFLLPRLMGKSRVAPWSLP